MGKKRLGMRGRSGHAGFSVLEVAIVIVVLLVALGSLSGTVVSSSHLARANENRALASDAARRMAAELSTTPFSDIFAAYNTDPSDDPAGVGTAPGSGFDVDGLTPTRDDADGMCGRIEFPDFDNGGGNFILDESIADAGFAMPRDLNGDNDTFDTFDTGYRLLPVRVWVEWSGVSGNRSIRFETMLSQR